MTISLRLKQDKQTTADPCPCSRFSVDIEFDPETAFNPSTLGNKWWTDGDMNKTVSANFDKTDTVPDPVDKTVIAMQNSADDRFDFFTGFIEIDGAVKAESNLIDRHHPLVIAWSGKFETWRKYKYVGNFDINHFEAWLEHSLNSGLPITKPIYANWGNFKKPWFQNDPRKLIRLRRHVLHPF